MSSAELRENRTLGWSASGDGRPIARRRDGRNENDSSVGSALNVPPDSVIRAVAWPYTRPPNGAFVKGYPFLSHRNRRHVYAPQPGSPTVPRPSLGNPGNRRGSSFWHLRGSPGTGPNADQDGQMAPSPWGKPEMF